MPGLIGRGGRISHRQKRVKVQLPGQNVPDGDGGWINVPVPANPPEQWAYIRPASTAALEQLTGGTVLSQASHLVTMPFHPEVTTQTTLVVEDYPYPDRTFNVLGLVNPDERDADMTLVCAEIVQ